MDKCTILKRVHGLKNLSTSILRAFKHFVRDVGVKPKLINMNFDKKIIGGKVKEFLEDDGPHLHIVKMRMDL